MTSESNGTTVDLMTILVVGLLLAVVAILTVNSSSGKEITANASANVVTNGATSTSQPTTTSTIPRERKNVETTTTTAKTNTTKAKTQAVKDTPTFNENPIIVVYPSRQKPKKPKIRRPVAPIKVPETWEELGKIISLEDDFPDTTKERSEGEREKLGIRDDLKKYKELVLHLRRAGKTSSFPLDETTLTLIAIDAWEKNQTKDLETLFISSNEHSNKLVRNWCISVLPKRRNCQFVQNKLSSVYRELFDLYAKLIDIEHRPNEHRTKSENEARRKSILAYVLLVFYMYYSIMLTHQDCCNRDKTLEENDVHRTFFALSWCIVAEHLVAERENLASIVPAAVILKRNDKEMLEYISMNLFNYKVNHYRSSSIGIGSMLASRALNKNVSSVLLGSHEQINNDVLIHLHLPLYVVKGVLTLNPELTNLGRKKTMTYDTDMWYNVWTTKQVGTTTSLNDVMLMFQINAFLCPLPHIREFMLADTDAKKNWNRLGEIRCMQQKDPYKTDRELYRSLYRVETDGSLKEQGPPTTATEDVHVCQNFKGFYSEGVLTHQLFERLTEDFIAKVHVLSFLNTSNLKSKPGRLCVRYDCSVEKIRPSSIPRDYEISHVFNVHQFTGLTYAQTSQSYLSTRLSNDSDATENIYPLQPKDYLTNETNKSSNASRKSDELTTRHQIIPVPIRKKINDYSLRFRDVNKQLHLLVKVSQIHTPFAKVVVRVHEKGEVQVIVRHYIQTSIPKDTVTVVTSVNELVNHTGNKLANFEYDSEKLNVHKYKTTEQYIESNTNTCNVFASSTNSVRTVTGT